MGEEDKVTYITTKKELQTNSYQTIAKTAARSRIYCIRIPKINSK
jgi:hypothetical protein